MIFGLAFCDGSFHQRLGVVCKIGSLEPVSDHGLFRIYVNSFSNMVEVARDP